jgi:hypothetical protein
MVSEEIVVTTQVKFDVMIYCMTHLTSHETFLFWCVYVDIFDIVHSLRWEKKRFMKVEHFRNLIRIGFSSIFYHQNIETDPVSRTLWIFQPETVDTDHNICHVQSILS